MFELFAHVPCHFLSGGPIPDYIVFSDACVLMPETCVHLVVVLRCPSRSGCFFKFHVYIRKLFTCVCSALQLFHHAIVISPVARSEDHLYASCLG
ncbi:hypothetical protein CENSYa_1067 [Cenarchaeum symbiosum A]|uniref:Uncharacterized protein n=1 Tax=Cenarchaeum symbiosum (strain A) TaxID=414004 RepID=A0RWI0_CENSY|nr:hypothetical protein CENSYa_1067 [Cenarchaeum symbiosum A]